MAKCILKEYGNFLPNRLPRLLQVKNIHSATEKKKHKIFGRLIKGRWVTSSYPPPTSSFTKNESCFEEYSGDNEESQEISDMKNSMEFNGRLVDQKPCIQKDAKFQRANFS